MQRRGCTDTEILTHQELPSAMSTTAPMLMLNDMPRVTLRAAEGEETLLLICPPTHFFPTEVCESTSTTRKGSATFGQLFHL